MNIFLDFNSSWYILLFAFLGAWAVLILARKKINSVHEIKEQVFLAFGGMISMAMMEFFAVSTGLWNYTPGNWPVILWPTYFVAILFGYQLLRSIERVLLRRPIMAWIFKLPSHHFSSGRVLFWLLAVGMFLMVRLFGLGSLGWFQQLYFAR